MLLARIGSGADPHGDGDGDGDPAAVDCDDTDPDVHPEVLEICDGVDTDCDPATPEPATGSVTLIDAAGASSDLSASFFGAYTVRSPGTLMLCGGVWTGNTAPEGGAIFYTNGVLSVSTSDFIANTTYDLYHQDTSNTYSFGPRPASPAPTPAAPDGDQALAARRAVKR